MAEAAIDQNRQKTLLGVSSVDLSTPTRIAVNPSTGAMLVGLAGGTGTVTSVSVVTANGVSGSVATATTTPAITLTLGDITPSKVNGLTISTSTGTLTLVNGSTLATAGANSITLTSTGTTNVTLPTSGTLMTNPMTTGGDVIYGGASGAPTRLANGSSGQVLTSAGTTLAPTWQTPTTGTVTAVSIATANGFSGSSTGGSTPALTIVAGAITPSTVNGLTISSTTGTFTLTNGKTFAVTNGLTLSGTDSTIMTFPSTSATIARIDAANTFTGASTASAWILTSPTITTKISPTADDGAPLGDTTHNFSDLFLASGAVINIANGNWAATHTSGILTVTTGDLRVTSANVGTNADSVPTLSSTSTLTNKTLTAPAISAAALTGASTQGAGSTISLALPTSAGATGKVTAAFNSGYSSTAVGDLMYLDSSATWQKADADASTTTESGMLGIALSVAASGAAVTVALPGSFVFATAWNLATVGAPVYMSATAGAITLTQPSATDTAIRIIGWVVASGNGTTKIWFQPSPDYITHT